MALLVMGGCKDENETDLSWLTNPDEKMELIASVTDIELDRDRPDDVALTFEWTPAREMSEDYVLSYVTKMDIEGHEFATCVRTDEEYGVFSKSYTTDELQRLLLEQWGQNYSKVVPVQFRVIAKWEGGDRYAKPEVRTVTVNIRPYRPLVWEADRIVLSGSAVPEDALPMSKTVEDEFQYAFVKDLVQGELGITLETGQGDTYVQLAEGVENWVDGEEVDVVLGDEPAKFQLPKDGEYRVILNTQTRKLKIYSPDKKLEPYIAEYTDKTGVPYSTTVTNLWAYGDITKWSNNLKDGKFKPSLADPQLLVGITTWVSDWGSEPGKKENGKFVLNVMEGGVNFPGGPNFSWCVGPVVPESERDNPNFKQKVVLELNKWTPIGMGSSVQQRESHFNWLMGTMLTIVDLRNQRIFMKEY